MFKTNDQRIVIKLPPFFKINGQPITNFNFQSLVIVKRLRLHQLVDGQGMKIYWQKFKIYDCKWLCYVLVNLGFQEVSSDIQAKCEFLKEELSRRLVKWQSKFLAISYHHFMNFVHDCSKWQKLLAAILQTTFSHSFSCIKSFCILIQIYLIMSPRIQLTICQHWFW